MVGHLPFATRPRTISRTVELVPGWHWVWYKRSEVESVPIKRQSITLKSQGLLTSDLYNVSAQAQVIYEIQDVISCCCHTFDYLETISDVAQLAVVLVIAPRTLEEIGHSWHTKEVRNELTRRVRTELRPYGIRVLKAFISDFNICETLRLVQNHPSSGAFVDSNSSAANKA